MKKAVTISACILALLILAISGHVWWLTRLQGNEQFPHDTYLDHEPNKTALIVVAHDDDAIGCAGTISELTKKGWKVSLLTFYGSWRAEDNPTRKKEVEQVAAIQHLANTDLIDFSLQKSDTVKEPWRPIPYSMFEERMHVDSLKTMIASAIEKYKPSVLFTLDSVIGGYGHPEHVCVSQSALDVCRSNTNLSVKKVYQAVFPKTLNENVLKNNPAFIAAKKTYNAAGSPSPTVEVNIYNSAEEKKQVMIAYRSQARNLKKIWPYYNLYPYWVYFKVFNTEHFHVITIK